MVWVGAVLITLLSVTVVPGAHAISFGQADNYRHANVVSLRFITTDLDAFASCTGTLIAVDSQKYVFLTAAHCAQPELGGWNGVDPSRGSIGVSFDEVNPQNSVPQKGAAYVTGGTAITHPLYRFPGGAGWNDRFDLALVVLPVDATNSLGETVASRWGSTPGALTPADLAGVGYVDQLVQSFRNPGRDLVFTAVGFGTQSDKAPQGSGTGNKLKPDPQASFPIRKLAQVGYKNLNGLMLNVVVNTTQGNFGYLCPGDSGGPAIYADSTGHERVLGVLTAGNCRSSGGYSRIDFQQARDFVDCAFPAGTAVDTRACVVGSFG